MNTQIKTGIALILATLALIACASTSRDPFNSPDSQRTRSGQAQGEMSKDMSK